MSTSLRASWLVFTLTTACVSATPVRSSATDPRAAPAELPLVARALSEDPAPATAGMQPHHHHAAPQDASVSDGS